MGARALLAGALPGAWLGVWALLAAAAPAGAAELGLRLRGYEQLGYDDNIGLNGNSPVGDFFSTTGVGAHLRAADPTLKLDLDALATFVRYLDEDSADTDNQYLRGKLARTGQRSRLGLEAGFVRDSTLTDLLTPTNGRQLDGERQTTWSLAPSFAYDLTRRDLLQLEGEGRRRSYDGDDRVDYWSADGSIGLQHQATRRTSYGAALAGGYVESSQQKSYYASPQAIIAYQYAQRLSLRFAAGPSVVWSESDIDAFGQEGNESDRTLGYTVAASAEYMLSDLTNLKLALTRDVEPSGDVAGSAVQTLRLDATASQKVAPRLFAELDAVLERESGVGDASFADRDYVQAQPRLRYALTSDLDLSLSYRLRFERYDDPSINGGDALSNAVFVRLDARLPEARKGW